MGVAGPGECQFRGVPPMNVADVIHGRVATIDLSFADSEGFPEDLVSKSEVLLRGDESGEWRIEIAGGIREVEGAAPRDLDTLRRIGVRGLPRLAWLAQATPARGPADRVLIQVHEFPTALTWDEPMDVGVDDRLVDDLRKRFGRSISVEGAVEWLAERMLLPSRQPDGAQRALLSGSPAPDAGKKTAFRLHGSGFAVDVQRGSDDCLRAIRVVTERRRIEGDERRPIQLVTAPIRFCDVTLAGEFRGGARTELDQLVAQADSYLGLWQAYHDKEREAILRRAREFGWVRYTRVERLPDGDYRFHLSAGEEKAADLRRRLDAIDGETLEAGDEVPTAIQGTDSEGPPVGPRRPFTGEQAAARASPPSLTLRPPPEQDDRKPPEQGYLFFALGGDEIRMGRRREAWERIRSCANPMPQLGLMIEGRPVPERRSRNLKPVTKAVRDVFANPTDRQRLALEVALNTPDIALVQGPPGTGKTRVIAALQARLAEVDEGIDPGGLSGNTLLTSFQHDAVENAASATRVMGLPAVKVGYRRGSVEARDGVDTWAAETAEAVRAARGRAAPEDSVHVALGTVREIALTYLQTPSRRDDPGAVLRQVSETAGPWLSAELVDDLARLRAELTAPRPTSLGDEDRDFALKAVRALRTEAAAFADDGPANAWKVLRRLERLDEGATRKLDSSTLLTAEERSCLERAAAEDPEAAADETLLADLEAVRNALIDRLRPADVGGASTRVHGDVESMINRIIDALTERARESAPGTDVAIAEWLADLENDPVGIRDTVRHYSMVLAATCQQSVSRPMADAKGGDETVFRTVIVDEAARSNPLDLLIPMACAERRIVLVGDHRQLPHLLEPDVEREIEGSAQEETRSALRQSLFEKLFIELREREKTDGVRRTVTLDTQYRMHPLLGQFLSEQFYAPHGEGFGSGRGEEEFAHDVALKDGISLAGKVAAWIDVPYARGGERPGRSKRRPVEARRVAEESHAVVARYPELSIGVIAFYAAQRDAIMEAASDSGLGLTERDDEGGYRIRDEWLRTVDGRERLRIGTVDAFQGKEFDIVFLSLTRSNEVPVKDEAARRRRYGFLSLENRLCVAMSRQHRLLVVAGDHAMAAGAEAEASVPALNAFLKLCEGPHGRVVRT